MELVTMTVKRRGVYVYRAATDNSKFKLAWNDLNGRRLGAYLHIRRLVISVLWNPR